MSTGKRIRWLWAGDTHRTLAVVLFGFSLLMNSQVVFAAHNTFPATIIDWVANFTGTGVYRRAEIYGFADANTACQAQASSYPLPLGYDHFELGPVGAGYGGGYCFFRFPQDGNVYRYGGWHRRTVCPLNANGGAVDVLGGPEGYNVPVPLCLCPGDLPCGTFVVRLSNDANSPASSDIAEIEPGKVTTTLRATVYDSNNQPVPNINVKLEATVEAHSGGHQHNDNRPKGLLSNGVNAGIVIEGNTGSGGMPFTFHAPAPAGNHKIKATCLDRDCTQEGPDKVWVGVKDLYQLNGSTAYELIQPNADVFHPGNHYLTTNASIVLQGIASEWRTLYKPFGPVLHLNDASLERGGYFDIQRLWNRGEHAEHRRGTVIDIRANNLPGAIPRGDFKDFERAARKYGAVARLHKKNTDLQHYHVRLFGRAE